MEPLLCEVCGKKATHLVYDYSETTEADGTICAVGFGVPHLFCLEHNRAAKCVITHNEMLSPLPV